MTAADSTLQSSSVVAPVLSFDHIQMTFPDGTEAVRDVSLNVSR